MSRVRLTPMMGCGHMITLIMITSAPALQILQAVYRPLMTHNLRDAAGP